MLKSLPTMHLATVPARTAGPRPSGQSPPTSEQSGHKRMVDLRAAIAAAYDEHHQLVYRLALRYGGGRAAWAEDVTQEVFLQLVRHAETLDDLDALGGWLYRTTTRRCLNKLRKERFLVWMTFDWILGSKDEPHVDGQGLAEARQELRAALVSLQRLPAKEQVAFAMHYLDGHTLEEIGEVMGLSKGYVSKLLGRAAAKLADEGWKVGDEQPPNG